MKTYLHTWNPKRWEWTDLEDRIASLTRNGFLDYRWSCGSTKSILPGDRVFLIRLGTEPRGIMASGHATSAVYRAKHWQKDREDETNYVDVRLDTLVNPETDGVLPLAVLQIGPTSVTNWTPQASGTSIDPNSAHHLEQLWYSFLEQSGQSPMRLPDELDAPFLYSEGASFLISVNVYERNPRARKACIDHHGLTCSVCGFNFEKEYGIIGKDFIHVHHIIPISEIRGEYSVDPIRDLIPICPNCHAMLHRKSSVLSIESLKAMLQP